VKVIYEALSGWSKAAAESSPGDESDRRRQWADLFRFLVDSQDKNLAGSAGNTLLCTAAGKGCLPLVQALVE
jgi:hypothetical protein